MVCLARFERAWLLRSFYSQSQRTLSNTVTTSDVKAPKATSFLQSTTLYPSSPTAQSWTSPLRSFPPETDIDTPTLTYPGTHTTTSEKENGIIEYLKVDDELGGSGLIVEEQSSRTLLPFSLVEDEFAKAANGGARLSQYTVSSVDSDHDFTGSSEFVVYVPSDQATLHQPAEVTSMKSSSSTGVFQSLSGQTSVGFSNRGTLPGTLGAVSRSKQKEIGSYVTVNLEYSSHLFGNSRHHQPTQTTRNPPKFDDLDLSTLNPITKSQPMDSTKTVPATTTATKNTVEQLGTDGSDASRVLSSHGVAVILGSISGASLLFAIIFYLHRFYFRRISTSSRGTGSVTQPKADNPAATCPDMSEILEISRFSADS
jgi:hypothetical protein